MKLLAVIFFVGSVVVTCSGRFLGNNHEPEISRTLKGVLKYYKEQTRVTDSESIEFEEPINNNAAVNEEELKRLQQKNNLNKNKVSSSVASTSLVVDEMKEGDPLVLNEDMERTTILPDDNIIKSKSDLNMDEVEDDLLDDCLEGDVMKISCNTCVCSEGKYFCSKKECQAKDKPLPPFERPSSKRKGVPIKYHSVKGGSNSGGTGGDPSSSDSILKSSSEDNEKPTLAPNVTYSEVDSTQCIEGRTKMVDCNQCVCAMGQWACTKTSCIALTLREKASYNGDEFLKSVATLKEHATIDDDCLEGETKKVDCNQCVCHMNSWSCSDFTCPSTEPPPKKENIIESCQTEEDVKSKDCNICSCRRGVWVCTKNDCKKFGNRYFNPIYSQKTGEKNRDE